MRNEPDTATFMADIIGREFRYIPNYGSSLGENHHSQASVGGSQQLVHIVEPVEFTRLLGKSAGASHRVSVETLQRNKDRAEPEGTQLPFGLLLARLNPRRNHAQPKSPR